MESVTSWTTRLRGLLGAAGRDHHHLVCRIVDPDQVSGPDRDRQPGDRTTLGLPVQLGQFGHWDRAAVDQVAEHPTGSDGRQLRRVADDHQVRRIGQRRDQRRRQFDVQHRCLVDDDQVRLDLVVRVVVEDRTRRAGGRWPGAEQPVHGGRVVPGELLQPLGRATGRSGQRDVGVHLAAQRHDGGDGPALAGTGTAGEQADAMRGGQGDRTGLHVVQTLGGALDGTFTGHRGRGADQPGQSLGDGGSPPAPTHFGRSMVRRTRRGRSP